MKKYLIPVVFIICVLAFAYTRNNTATEENATIIKVGKEPNSVEVADINGDKKLDVIVANGGDSSVTVLLGKGRGQFTEAVGSPFYAGCAPNDIAIADINKDGKPDLVFANHTKKYLTVLVSNGEGSFKSLKGSPFSVAVIPHSDGVTVADFNRYCNADLFTDSWGNDRIEILFGNNKHGFDTPGKFISVGRHPYQRLRVADLNRDGNADIVTTNLDGSNCTVLLGNGKGDFIQPPGSPFPCHDSPFGVAIGDINGDGMPDLAIVNSPTITSDNTGNDGLTILTGDGSGKFLIMPGSPFATGKSPSRVAIGDINGDGINDVVTTNYNSSSITVFLMGKGKMLSSYTLRTGQKPGGIAVADVDGNGKNDILVTNSLDNTLEIIRTIK